MSNTENWKKKYESALALLKKKEEILQDYRKTIKQSASFIKEVTEKLSSELKMAHQIHQVLLPSELPVIAGCEFSFKFQPAATKGLSKDFYEVIPPNSKHSFALIMSSCSSYALSALMFSARLKMMSRGSAQAKLKPHEFLSLLVKEINADRAETAGPHPLKSKASLFYAVVDQKTYDMSFCLVGDIAVLKQDEKKIHTLHSETENLFDVKNIKTHTLSLNPGNRVVICSPGVLTQTPVEGGSSYSLESLKKSLKEEKSSSVHEVRNRIFYDLKSVAQGRPTEKDQSVFIMEVKKTTLKLTKIE